MKTKILSLKNMRSLLLFLILILGILIFGIHNLNQELRKDLTIYEQVDVLEVLTASKRLELEAIKRAQEEVKQRQRLREKIVREAKEKAIYDYLDSINAPLKDKASYFVYVSEKYDLPFWLLPSICVAESGCGKNVFRPYNPFGWGKRSFKSWEEAIETVGKGLRKGYFEKGCDTLDCLWRVYSASSPNWYGNVKFAAVEIVGRFGYFCSEMAKESGLQDNFCFEFTKELIK